MGSGSFPQCLASLDARPAREGTSPSPTSQEQVLSGALQGLIARVNTSDCRAGGSTREV